MLRSGKRYQPVSEMSSEIADLMKAWMAESRKQEQRHEEERVRQQEERAAERRRYEQEREADRQRYEELVRGLTERRPRRVEVGPESLKLTKLSDTDDIEAFLTTFERAVEAHGVERDKRAAILAPQLTGKARLAYAAMSDEDARDYDRVKAAIFQRYDINEETYRRRFRAVQPKENETPVELVIRVRDLAEKWLKDCGNRQTVVDTLVMEQFVEVLPDDVRVWVKERKPRTSQEAGRLAEDYRQARKAELWTTTSKKGGQKHCFNCCQPGHIAKDCPKRKVGLPPAFKGEDATKAEKKKKVEKLFLCYNCGGKGHTSRQCPSDALFCKERSSTKPVGRGLVHQPFQCKGVVEGQFVNDIVLDTGCLRTLVRSDLVEEQNRKHGETVTIQCAHGDAVSYPLASVELEVQGNVLTVEAAVSDKLPSSVLLGTDVPNLFELLQSKQDGKALMVVTRSQAKRLQNEHAEDIGSTQNSIATPVMVHKEEVTQGGSEGELRQPESHQEPNITQGGSELELRQAESDQTNGSESGVTPGKTDMVLDNNVWQTEFNLNDEMFVGSQKAKVKKSRSEKRKARNHYAEVQIAQRNDFNLDISRQELRKLQDDDLMIQNCRKRNPDITVERNGLWYHLWKPKQEPGKTVEQLLIPKQYHHIICKLAHTIPMAGHLGRDKTTKRITKNFYWPSVFRDVAEYCQRCPECQKTGKGSQHKVPLVPLPVIQEPFERIAMDIVGPLPRSKKGNQYILVICDYATRYPEAMAMRRIEAGVVAEKLMELFSRVGIPKEILSDQGTNFMSQLLKELYNLLHVHPIRTSPYHPQTDGLVERFNKTLKSVLRRFVNKEGRDWDRWLPYVLFAYREVPQSTTGFSPFELLYGREVRGPLDVLREEWEADQKSDLSVLSHILAVRERMEEMSEIVKENLREAQGRQKLWYDHNARERELEPDDEVLVLLPTSSNKLLAQWQGPYRVLRKTGRVNYEIDMKDKRKRKKIFHVTMLKKWYPPEDTSFWTAEEVESEPEEEELLPNWRGESGTVPDISTELTEQQKLQLTELLADFKTVMSGKVGRTSSCQHHIRLKEELPVRQQPYRLPHMYKEAVEGEIEVMINEGIIEPANSEWASPMVIVKKKDGAIRLCVDYRRLNAVTRVDAYPMPRMDDILDQVGQAKYITTLDLAKGYWQVPVASQDRHKTAFTTPRGLYQFKMMPFGLCGAPATFQRMMDQIIKGLYKFTNAYLDDLIIFSTSWEDHLIHLRTVLSRLQELGLTTKPSKCQFAMTECTYLGHVVGNGVVKPEEGKLRAIEQFQRPKTKKQIRTFLGLTGYYRRFIPNYATIAASLTNMTKKLEPEIVNWTTEGIKAFNKLKEILSSSPVMRNPDFSRPFILQTDASEVGVGAVLSQTDTEGYDHPVAYFSRKLLSREQKYSTIEKECLAIKLGVQAFQTYLLGQEFVIQTDHWALQWLTKFKDSNARLMRWSLALQPFRFQVQHRKGVYHANADALSRQAQTEEGGRGVIEHLS